MFGPLKILSSLLKKNDKCTVWLLKSLFVVQVGNKKKVFLFYFILEK